jgi:hypothetical protein
LPLAEERDVLESSLLTFVEGAWPSLDPSAYQSCWAIDALCEHLQAVTEGQIKRLLVISRPERKALCATRLVTPTEPKDCAVQGLRRLATLDGLSHDPDLDPQAAFLGAADPAANRQRKPPDQNQRGHQNSTRRIMQLGRRRDRTAADCRAGFARSRAEAYL